MKKENKIFCNANSIATEENTSSFTSNHSEEWKIGKKV